MKNPFKRIDYDRVPLFFRKLINVAVSLRLLSYPYKKIKIIGVTGTSGKTTTTTLLYKIAQELGYKAGLIGTVENFIGDRKLDYDFYKEGRGSFFERFFYSTSRATPEIWQLDKLFSEMIKEGCEYVFMEVSSHGLEEKRVSKLQFTGAIFTNLSQDHMDFHKNMGSYFKAKKKLFNMLPRKSFALTNADDAYGLKIVDKTKAHAFTYGFDQGDDGVLFAGKIHKSDFSGLDLAFNDIKIMSKLIGKFNAYNLLAVWSTCSLLGFDMNKVNKILETIEPPAGRFDYFVSGGGVVAIVDYAHKPDALENVLKTAGGIKALGSKIISVVGCGGDRDVSKRPVMGKIASDLSDVAIFTSDNPRSEDPDEIIKQMKTGLTSEDLKKVITIADRRLAIKEAVKLAKKGDIILCAGKGHETYQETKGVKTHFDDMEEFKKAFI